MSTDAAIVAGAIAGGITGGIIAVILTLGLLRRERLISGRTTIHAGPSAPGRQWRFASGPLMRRITRRGPPAAASPPARQPSVESGRPSEQ
jgi:hypothetical protein